MIRNPNREVWEGWTVKSFIDHLDPIFQIIMEERSWRPVFTTEEEIKIWCADEQPYYKHHIPEVFEYFRDKFKTYNKEKAYNG